MRSRRNNIHMVYLTALPAGLSRQERVKIEHLSGWALLRLGLLRRGFCAPETTVDDILGKARRGPKGKPFFPEPGCQFSISHSRGLVGCALESVPVGLDIERVRKFSPDVIEKMCTPEEALMVSGEDRGSRLTQLWTCKESHMKLTGLGFSQGLQETAFRALGAEPRLAGQDGAYFHSTSLEHGGDAYWLTLCSAEPINFQIEWIDFANLSIIEH